MNAEKIKKDLYYTSGHEWIDFQGTVAYIGVCSFKLKGIREIQQIMFSEDDGLKMQGDLVATVRYDDYEVQVNMPVDGKITRFNEIYSAGQQEILLHQAETNGWIALIVPSKPYDRKNLLQPEQYKSLIQRRV